MDRASPGIATASDADHPRSPIGIVADRLDQLLGLAAGAGPQRALRTPGPPVQCGDLDAGVVGD